MTATYCCITGIKIDGYNAQFALFRHARPTHPLCQWALTLDANGIRSELANVNVREGMTRDALISEDSKIRLLSLAWLHLNGLASQIWKPESQTEESSASLSLSLMCLKELVNLHKSRLVDCPHISSFSVHTPSTLYFAIEGDLNTKVKVELRDMLCLVSDLAALAQRYADRLPVLVRALTEAGMSEHPALMLGKMWMLEKALTESDDPDAQLMLSQDLIALANSEAEGSSPLHEVLKTFVTCGGLNHKSLSRTYSGKVIAHLSDEVPKYIVTKPQEPVRKADVEVKAPTSAIKCASKLKAKLFNRG